MAYDVFFLSYGEPNADENFAHLKSIRPNAKRIDGVDGLLAAHQECAKRCFTSHFFVVDADSVITEPSVFEYTVPAYDAQYVHLWFAKNAVNHLVYGWGGLKLFPKKLMKDALQHGVDMTTSFELKIIPVEVSTTMFNSSEYETWRSAFRECAKLSRGVFKEQSAEENAMRLVTWKTTGGYRPFGNWCIKGAIDGEEFASQNEDISCVNDWKWLRAEFDRRYP
jgi:hypothetical protein